MNTITDKEVEKLFGTDDIRQWAEEIENSSEDDRKILFEHVKHLENEGTNWWLLLTKYLLTKSDRRKELLKKIRYSCIYN